MFGKIEVQVEASQVALLLFYDFLNLELREDHASLRVVGMGQRQKSLRKEILVTDLVRGHASELGPGHSRGQFYSHTFLKRFAPIHYRSLSRAVTQVITFR